MLDGKGVEAEHVCQHARRGLIAFGDVHPHEAVFAHEQGRQGGHVLPLRAGIG
jgi:hypothetical protein